MALGTHPLLVETIMELFLGLVGLTVVICWVLAQAGQTPPGPTHFVGTMHGKLR